MPISILGYGEPEGRIELRNTLARYLKRTRGVECHPNQLVITSGATQAFSLITKMLLSNRDKIMIEDPITHEIQSIFTSTGASLVPIQVDPNGIKTEILPANKNPKFIFVTPSHQFPLGSILPIQRRIQLIQYARENNCFIVEDDYDSEFRYEGEPISALQGLDYERVIYVGTFSKNLSPALRLGYLVLPPSLISKCKQLKWFHDLHTPSLDQMILARFIEEGLLERHIRKMKKLYMTKRDTLINCLKNCFGESVSVSGNSTGLHLIVDFHHIQFTEKIIREIEKFEVKVYQVEQHTIEKNTHRTKLLMGYGNLTKKQIEEGIKRLDTWHQMYVQSLF